MDQVARPSVVVFDVNETLSDLSPMAQRFAEVGAPGQLAKTWFASLLRDGFALATAGSTAPFAALGEGVLRILLTGIPLRGSLDDAVGHIMAGFAALPVHPDVPTGIRSLQAAGVRLVTLSNGSADVAEQLFARAGLGDAFDLLLSVTEAGVWKPAGDAYRYAARRCETPLAEMLLVAAHPWDIDGAARAGMGTAWINRTRSPYPDYFCPPDMTAADLDELARSW